MPGFDTICLHGGYEADPTTGARAVPIYRTTPYQFKDTTHAANLFALAELGNIYTRLQNPTTDVMEKRVCLLEGAHELGGLGLASGTAAVFNSIINVCENGDNIVASSKLYGGTYTMFNNILPSMGITCKFVDASDPSNFAKAADDKTRAFFCETVSNPALEVVDLEEVAKHANEIKVPLMVDATFSTPYLTNPIAHGAHIVIHSLTKWMGGHGNALGGCVVDSGTFKWAESGRHPLFTNKDESYGGLLWGIDLPAPLLPLAFILRMRTVPLRNLGSCISPDNSWAILNGMETLSLRMERHCSNALAVAEYLLTNKAVTNVRFPGLPTDSQYEKQKKYIKGKGGSMVVFEMVGGVEAGKAFINNLKLISHVANVGDCKTLAIHPASTTHSQLNPEQQKDAGIPPGLVRLSVGIETIEDIIEDIVQAVKAAEKASA
jgi:O-acetylhomoserine (thiol)-lyase